jgi:predicted TPR repeat methyltransferase
LWQARPLLLPTLICAYAGFLALRTAIGCELKRCMTLRSRNAYWALSPRRSKLGPVSAITGHIQERALETRRSFANGSVESRIHLIMLPWLKKLSSRRPSESDARELKKRADEHLLREEWDAASACYSQALAIDDNYVDACIGLGFVLLEQKQYGQAEVHLRRALSLGPHIADVHYLLGRLYEERNDEPGEIVIDHLTRSLELKPNLEVAYRALYFAFIRRGQTEQAKAILGKAVSAFPASAEFHAYMGQLLDRENSYEDSIACYEKALLIQPESADLQYLLGEAYRRRGDVVAASIAFRNALTLNPDLAPAHLSLAIGLESQGKIDEAIDSFQHAVTLDRNLAAAHHHLGNAYMRKGAINEAISCFREVARLEPHSGVIHLIEALSGSTSERAPSQYVEKLFDEYADRFDAHLVHALNYSIPERLAELLSSYAGQDVQQQWDVLDLGCGTGLVGLAIKPYARGLVGVDLSAKMLEKAAARHLYNRLECLDLVAMIKSELPNSYDLVIAGDVLVYLGRLDELARNVRRILRPKGMFAFSVESLDALESEAEGVHEYRDFRLTQTGRYAHSARYLRSLASDEGFSVLQLINVQGRVDKAQAVQHYLALLRLTSAEEADNATPI